MIFIKQNLHLVGACELKLFAHKKYNLKPAWIEIELHKQNYGISSEFFSKIYPAKVVHEIFNFYIKAHERSKQNETL
jgi:hypothetical protein